VCGAAACRASAMSNSDGLLAAPLRCGLLALAAVAACLTMRLERYGEEDVGGARSLGPDPPRLGRLAEYCHPPVDSGTEGHPPLAALELRAVVLTVRHGDRSAIHSIPGSLPPKGGGFSCSPEDLDAVWRDLPARYRVISTATLAPIERPFRPQLREGSTSECAPGQLTARGFRQHLALGTHLHEAYKEFLAGLERSGGRLYVRSTDYPRTIGSAAALLTSLLPPSLWPARIDIEVNEDEAAEIMHGVGTKSSSKAAGDGAAERVIEGSCRVSVRRSAAQFDAWKRPKEYARLRTLFGEAAVGRAVTDFADAMFAATCHRLPLPCGAGGCADHQLAEALAHRADEYYCARFAGAEGGAVATQLSFYPFLHEVLGLLQEAAPAGSVPSLAVFSGHNTVIAPLLSALGVYWGRLCRWPPYASRISFELYRSPQVGVDGSAQHFMRVLFNGEALVGMRGCGAGELCPLEDFAQGVASLLGGASDLAAACAA